MILLLPFLRRFSVHTRTIIGATVTAVAALALPVALLADRGLTGPAVISAVVGGLFLMSAFYDHRHGDRAVR